MLLAGNLAAWIGQRERQIQRAVGRLAQVHRDVRLLARHIGRDLDARDMRGGARLEIDALPQPADWAIPALLAVRNFGERELGELRRIATRVGHAHHQLVRAIVAQRSRGIQLERQVAALVLAQQLPVQPNRRVVIDRAEMDESGLSARLRIGGVDRTQS